MLSYTLGLWDEIFQVLEAKANKTPNLLSEGIRIAKGEVVKMNKCTVNFIEASPE